MAENLANENPLVSVIIPVYNGEKYIEECLRSVYQQSYHRIEIILIDDGSTDNSLNLINQFPGEKKVISQQNTDVSQARNVGIQNADGQFIAFLDQDDVWENAKLEKQVHAFRENPDTDLVFTDSFKFNDKGDRRHPRDKHEIASRLNDQNLFSTLVRKNILMPSAVMIKKESIEKAGLFDSSFKTCGDYEMWLRMAAMGMKFKYLPEPLALYRQHAENTYKKSEIMHEDRLKALDSIFGIGRLTPEQQRLKPFAYASAYAESAHAFFANKNYGRFLENAHQAVSSSWKVIDSKFISRYLRSWLYVNLLKRS